MRVTIVVPDGFVAVDGRGFDKLDLTGLSENIHAVQWYGQVGEVEYAVDALGVKPPNVAIDSLTPFQPAIDAWAAARDAADAPPPPPTPEQIMARMEASVQRWLDEQAQALGYDDIKSAVTYAEESAVPKFQQEGQALRRLRSLVWARCYEILNAVQAEQRPIPTEAELIAEMEVLK